MTMEALTGSEAEQRAAILAKLEQFELPDLALALKAAEKSKHARVDAFLAKAEAEAFGFREIREEYHNLLSLDRQVRVEARVFIQDEINSITNYIQKLYNLLERITSGALMGECYSYIDMLSIALIQKGVPDEKIPRSASATDADPAAS